MQMRHEYKHSINRMDYTILVSRLRGALSRDIHAGASGAYRVRSLYFDTPNDRALRDKVSGTDRREKFRIRRYPGSASPRIALEKKVKIHGLCCKTAAFLTEAECNNIIIGHDIEWMAADGRPLVAEFYSKIRGALLRPKAIIEYSREPFVYAAGNVRVTFDTNIRTGLFSRDLLNDAAPLVPAGDEIVLMEVKYDAFIPSFIVDLLQVDGRRASACSKYAIGRMYG
ncbi:MAG: polyphosphate polymerase domain-containing protein [Clostridiales Family XIII bacterium]|jgi:hypothetical protein|nr:polyphosphate polymerase domain-containing protein [Clostridiales Family XIII bacterium]